MKGITADFYDNYSVFYIEEFTKDIREELHKELVSICHGTKLGKSGFNLYSLSTTIRELLKRYPQNDDKRKGFIAELLLNLIIRSYFSEFEVSSPFFNKEKAADAKNGFDIILFNKDDKSLWITESKGGSLSDGYSINSKMDERLYAAHYDLKTRMNSGNTTLWYNAFNDALISMEESDEKEIVLSILDGTDSSNSENNNVILAGTVFHDISDKFESEVVNSRVKFVEKTSIYNKVKIIAIQKSTYEEVYNFITQLGEKYD